jgi:ABC-type dipeptide/oligopeptide/nickel transport system permease subunit
LDVLSLKIKKEHGTDLGSLGDYLPMNASDGLLTFPANPLKQLAQSSLPTNYTNLVIALAVFYLLLFIFISRRVVLKRDL